MTDQPVAGLGVALSLSRPIGEVADAAISKMAAEGAAGPAALVAWLLLTLDDKLQRKGYPGAFVAADYSTVGAVWWLHVSADTVPSLFRRYVTHDLNKAIANAEEWIASLPEGR